MNSCKLFETLAKADIKLDQEHTPTSYNCTDACPWFGKCFFNVSCPPKNPRLQKFFGGWQKYACYNVNDKTCTLESTGGSPVINILHLISPEKVMDIIIFRIAKKSRTEDNYNIRYIAKQGGKNQLCANLQELNNYISKKFDYSGRELTIEDFKNV